MGQDQMHYDQLLAEALRSVLPRILDRAMRPGGLPEPHHLYIAFRTRFPGVVIGPKLLEEHPEEMTIVLKSHYWDLELRSDRFDVTLSFGGKKERLIVPYAAVTQISDPSVPFGLRFEVLEPPPLAEPEPGEDEAEPEEGGNVVSLFKKRP